VADTEAAVPGHVRAGNVMDFDIFHIPGADEDVHRAWKRLHESGVPDLIWTPRNQGHWIAARAADISEIFKDHARFSSLTATIVPNVSPIPLLPLESDPPQHEQYRKVINPSFAPAAVSARAAEARDLAIELIEGFAGRGKCEFVGEFARRMPIDLFLRMAGLPPEDREFLTFVTEHNSHHRDQKVRNAMMAVMMDYLRSVITLRKARSGDDLLSRIVHSRPDGRPLSEEEVLGMCTVVLFGGLDTLASLLGFVARFLAESPAHRRQLIDRPELVPQAVEELLRRFAVAGVGRIAAADTAIGDVVIKRGERIWLASFLHNLDERLFEDPLAVDFNRRGPLHASFGNGNHRCPGSNLARTEVRIFLEEWLRRIPDFRIPHGAKPATGAGIILSMKYLPLQW
jgi:cytochrome P450